MQIYKYKYTITNIPIQIYKYKYTNIASIITVSPCLEMEIYR